MRELLSTFLPTVNHPSAPLCAGTWCRPREDGIGRWELRDLGSLGGLAVEEALEVFGDSGSTPVN